MANQKNHKLITQLLKKSRKEIKNLVTDQEVNSLNLKTHLPTFTASESTLKRRKLNSDGKEESLVLW